MINTKFPPTNLHRKKRVLRCLNILIKMGTVVRRSKILAKIVQFVLTNFKIEIADTP